MKPFARRSGVLSLGLAVFLTLIISGQTLAVSWGARMPLTTTGTATAMGVARLGLSSVVALYYDQGRISVRRSVNSGRTWGSPVKVSDSSTGESAVICGSGSAVHVAWSGGSTIRYARSTNGGSSFGGPVTLAVVDHTLGKPSIARGANGKVVVAWAERTNSGLVKDYVRVSRNGGASFASAKVLASASAGIGIPVVAVGNGVIYFAYNNAGVIRLIRSTDGGTTWAAPRAVVTDAYADPTYELSLTAAGTRAYIAYLKVAGAGPEPHWVRYSRSVDSGLTWAAGRDLSPNSSSASYRASAWPAIDLQGGVVRVVFERCLVSGCASSAIFYRQSSNGLTWTSAQMVSVPTDTPRAFDGDVAYAGKVIVAYTGLTSPGDWLHDIWVRITGS